LRIVDDAGRVIYEYAKERKARATTRTAEG
jgi:hypothetical protein